MEGQDIAVPHVSGCFLHSVPVEIGLVILGAQESLSDLHAIIRASPYLYKLFASNKASILLEVLWSEIGPGFQDALMLARLPQLHQGSESYTTDIEELALTIISMRSRPMRALARECSLDEIHSLVRTFYTTRFFAELYTWSKLTIIRRDVQPGAASPVKANHDAADASTAASTSLAVMPADMPIATSERHRVLRSLYRHQIFARLDGCTALGFRWNVHSTTNPVMYNFYPRGTIREGHVAKLPSSLLLDQFPPWELQQQVCATAFIEALAMQLSEVPPTLGHQLTGRDLTSPLQLAPLFVHLEALRAYIRALAADAKDRGFGADTWARVMARVSRARPEVRALVCSLYMRLCERTSLGESITRWESLLPSLPPVRIDGQREDDWAEELMLLARENGNKGTDGAVEDADAPPWAWVDALGGRYHSWFGEYLPGAKQSRRTSGISDYRLWSQVGFPMWDQRRVISIKAYLDAGTLETGWLAVPPADSDNVGTAMLGPNGHPTWESLFVVQNHTNTWRV